jgi:hypothetical protein
MEPPEDTERRRYSRIAFDMEATLTQARQIYPLQLLDISLKGVLAKVEQAKAIDGGPASLCISLADKSQIRMAVVLVRRDEQYLGFRSTRIEVESAARLRRLLELNLNISNAAERVIDELVATSFGPIQS